MADLRAGMRRATARWRAAAAVGLAGCATATAQVADAGDGGGVDRPTTADTAAVVVDAPATVMDAPATVMDAPVVAADVPPPAPLRLAVRDQVVTPVGGVRQPSVCFHPASDAYVTAYTWVIPDTPTPRFRVEARALTVDAAGALGVGSPLMVDDETPAHDAGDPAIAAGDGPDAPALVVWVDDRSGPGARGSIEVYARFVRPTGGASPGVAAMGAVFDVSQRPGGNEALPAVAWDAAAGVFLVAWADDRERGVRHEDARVVYARTVTPDGRVGPELRLGDDELFQTNPSVASCGDGRFLVAWTDYQRDGAVLVSRARGGVFDARTGAALTPLRTWGEARDVPQDLVPAQCAPDRDGWWVAWGVGGPPSIRQLRVARLAPDASVRAVLGPEAQPDGSRAARLAAVAATGQVVLTQLAQDSNRGYALLLDRGASALPPPAPLTPAEPTLGTFWSAVAASERGTSAVAVMTLDYNRLHATTFVAP